ncbi:hypothetical protein [Pseudodesulfovibrio methanolicus]|uniref:Lipoprotein n=1 Tax=Pseudodesulfovibrio methanolicus TaxID=3126690 RepID=A0ABZ2J144_9BACT
MHGPKLGHILLLGALTALPGCLAINAALGVLGAMGPPAAQLAGAAYTVAEYSYEYGAHDRTPDEVFLAKFDWLLADGDEPDPSAFAGALSAAVPGPQVDVTPRPIVVAANAADPAGPRARPGVTRAAGPVAATGRPVRLMKKATPVAAASRAASPKRIANAPARAIARKPALAAPVRRTTPVHHYAVHAPDPLLARLDRLENGLAQAEALYLSETAGGLRLSVPPCDGDPCAQGVNGGYSLRLPVMYNAPRATGASSARAG